MSDPASTFARLPQLQRVFLLRLSLAMGLLVILSGCSSTRLIYGVIDNYILWKLGDYATLNSEQKQQAKQAVKRFHQWHRTTQLPLYADYLDRLIPVLNRDDITGAILHDKIDELQLLLDQSSVHLIKPLAKICSHFSDEQVAQVMEKFTRKKAQYRKDYVDISDKKRYKIRRDDLNSYMKPYFGSYSKEQAAMLRHWSETLLPYENHLLAQRDNWQNAIKVALDERHDSALLEKRLNDIMLYRTDNWGHEIEAIIDHNQTQTYDMIAAMIISQSPKQRQRMNNKLKALAEDFRILSRP